MKRALKLFAVFLVTISSLMAYGQATNIASRTAKVDGHQSPLLDRRPRYAAHPVARLCRDLADVEADHSCPGPALHGNRAGPAWHRRLGHSRRRSGYEERRHPHS